MLILMRNHLMRPESPSKLGLALTLLIGACSAPDRPSASGLASDPAQLFLRSCGYQVQQEGVWIQGSYGCEARRIAGDNLRLRFTMQPKTWVPSTIQLDTETATLDFLYTNSTHALFDGVSDSGAMIVRLGVPRPDSNADFLLQLIPGDRPLPVKPVTGPGPQPDPAVPGPDPALPSDGPGATPGTPVPTGPLPVCNGETAYAPTTGRLPFESGKGVILSQGPGGTFSHPDRVDAARQCVIRNYAYDFPVSEGTPITAARAGTVLRFRSNSSTGGPDESFAPFANYVVILHKDGTLGLYAHLQWMGVKVQVQQQVEAGEVIATSGNTGFSTGPHLHFEIRSSDGRYPIGVRFATREFPDGAFPVAGDAMTAP